MKFLRSLAADVIRFDYIAKAAFLRRINYAEARSEVLPKAPRESTFPLRYFMP